MGNERLIHWGIWPGIWPTKLLKLYQINKKQEILAKYQFPVDATKKRWYYSIRSPNGAPDRDLRADRKRMNIQNSSENKIKKLLTETT
jgi:hypothetical protein